MTAQITLTLPTEIYECAEHLAQRTGRDVSDILTHILGVSLPTDLLPAASQPLESLADDMILALADSRMEETQNARISALLLQQQASELDELEQQELSLLLYIYQEGSLRKARALVEAVRRGLPKPLRS